ncbi:MAG: ABC transporter ATP-binding protein, partial [Campylobacter sp.]|nr:ABC transporter ATP-binding protein [Campylobacter sp.]
PEVLTNRLENCSFYAVGASDKRALMDEILAEDEVLDSYLVGSKIKIILKQKDENFISNFKLSAQNEIKIQNAPSSFEDAFTHILQAKTTARSPLYEILTTAPTIDDFAVEAINLTKIFGDFKAASDINFKIKRGEIFGFLGPNGAGKSTTFKMICGLLTPSGGSAKIYGLPLAEMKDKIGYMAQKFSLYSSLSVADNLNFFAGIYGLKGEAKTQKIKAMSEIFNLNEFLNLTADSLSLGLKQRLALACSLMHSPVVLFLDEATSGVDPLTRKEFWRHINAVSAMGISVMITTHLMDEAELCDRIMLISDGKEIATGTPDELKNRVGENAGMEDAFIALVNESRAKNAEISKKGKNV